MTTVLAAQLQKLADTNVRRFRGKASLLYTFQQAADVGIDAIYAVGLQGLEQLCALDIRFQPFRQTLFSQSNLAYVREQQTAEVNSKLDASILSFCQLLSGYFLLPPAFKTLEYLIRRYKVNEHNLDALMQAALPYHSTNEFVRLVHVLRLEGGASRLWEFLAPMQKSGAALPREVLVQRCVSDRALLRFVCDMARQLSQPRQQGRVVMSFYAVVLCEYLVTLRTVSEAVVTQLLPYLVEGLRDDVIPDYRAATHMIITQLASRVSMSAELAIALVQDLCKGASSADASLMPQSLMVLAHLAATQPSLRKVPFPSPALRHLAQAGEGGALELGLLAEKGVQLGPLLGLLVEPLAARAPFDPECGALLEGLLAHVPLGNATDALVPALLAHAGREAVSQEGDERTRLLRLLRALELRCPIQLDHAVNAALAPRDEDSKAAPDGARALRLDESGRQRLFALLESAFAGSARLPLLEAGTTLAMAVDAPSAAVREMALQKLSALSISGGDGGADPELAAFVHSSLLRRLQDDAPSVALAALRVEALAGCPAGPLFDALSACLLKSVQQAIDPATRKPLRKEFREVAKEVLRQLGGPAGVLARHPSLADRGAVLLLAVLPATPLSVKLSSSVLKCAATLDHPLLEGLAGVSDASGGEPQPPPTSTRKNTKGKKGKKGGEMEVADAAFNRRVLAALAQHVAAHTEAQQALLRLLRDTQQAEQAQEGGTRTAERAPALLLAVALGALKLEGGASMAGQVLSYLVTVAPPTKGLGHQEQQQLLLEGGTLSDVSLSSLAQGTLSQHAVRAALVLGALEVVPAEWLAEQGEEGAAALFSALAQQVQHAQRQEQLQVLTRRAAEVAPVSHMLSSIYAQPLQGEGAAAAPTTSGLPASLPAVTPQVQVAALEMFAWGAGSLEGGQAVAARGAAGQQRGGQVKDAGGDAPLAFLLRLLSTLASPDRAVRAAGAGAVQALALAIQEGGGGRVLGDLTPGGLIQQESLRQLLEGVGECRGAIEADAEAFEALMQRSLAGVKRGEAPPGTARKGGRGPVSGSGGTRKKAPQLLGGRGSTRGSAGLGLAPEDAAASGQLLLTQLPAQRGAAGLHAAALALRCIADWAPPGELLLAGWQLLVSFWKQQGMPTQQQAELAAGVMSLYTPTAVGTLLSQDEARGREVVGTLLAALMPAQLGSDAVRLAALGMLSAELYETLPTDLQRQALEALLKSHSSDPEEGCRGAARASLAALQLAPSTLCALLDVAPAPAEEATEGTPPAAKKKKAGRRAGAAAAPADVTLHIQESSLDLCIAALEMLQWKEHIPDAALLVAPIQATLAALLRCQVEEGAASTPPAPPAGTYAMQLALSMLLSLAKRAQQQGTGTEGFDLDLAVQCAQVAPDGALRNAALSLVAQLAEGAPSDVLHFVLRVVGVVGRSAAIQADAHSAKVAAQVLKAVVPAWVSGGGSVHQLVAAVVAAAPSIPSYRRLHIFGALVDALPQVDGLSATLAALLEQELAPAQQAGEGVEADADVAWGADLAAALLARAPLPRQAAALAALLKHSMQSAVEQSPAAPLPLLSTAFATTQLQLQASRSAVAGEGSAELAEGHEALLRAALVQLQRAGEMAAAEGRGKQGKKGGGGAAAEGLKQATEVTYKLLQALQRIMPPTAYLSSLAVLVSSPLDRVRRRALALIGAGVKSGAEQGAEGGMEEGEEEEAEGAAGTADAALAAVQPAVQLLQGALPAGHEPASAITKQTALATLGALSVAYGPSAPQQFLAALPAVLATVQDSRAAVRSSALACVASVTRALGPRMVPALPSVVKGVLGAAQRAALAVARAGGVSTSTEAGASDTPGAEEGGGKLPTSEALGLELAASLAATSALVESLGAFLAPHLPALLDVLLAPAVLSCHAADCSELAMGVRQRLAGSIPPRLLLPPLLAHLEASVEGGYPSVCALLSMLSAAVDSMDGAATAAHHKAVCVCLLQALDLRRRRPAALAPPEHVQDALRQVESAAVVAFVGLTLRLSEVQFKPLFLRLLDWATGAPAGGAVARGVALCTLVNALTERLRSVFVPYFRYLLGPLLDFLSGSPAAGAGKDKKKKKKKQRVAEEAGGDAVNSLEVEDEWRLRLQSVRALHRCLLFDSVGFLDEPKFELVLPPLVDHLSMRPPAAATSALERDATLAEDAALVGEDQCDDLDVMGLAVVACIAQLAVTAGSDALWKTLNHQVLMASRSLDPRTRLLCLEAVAKLVGRLREEYLVLLPETLPFLAELLEDAESAVEARAAALLRSLEELSGESLAEYLKA